MKAVRVVLVREYLQRVRNRAFIISTIAFPVLMTGFIAVPAYIESRDNASGTRIALVDETGSLEAGLIPRLENSGFRVEVIAAGSEALDEARAEIEAGELAGILEVGPGTLADGTARFTTDDAPSTLRRVLLGTAVSETALEVVLGGVSGAEAARALVDGGGLEVIRLDETGPTEGERTTGLVAGGVGAFLLYMTLLVYGTMVLRAVLEEKTSRIVEVIVSSMRPWELMLGKVLGVGAVGLTQLAIWLGFAGLLVGIAATPAIPFLAGSDVLENLPGILPSAWVFAFFFVCFLLGYFMFASLFAAVGAMCSTEEEAQQMQFPVVMLVVVPVIFLTPILDDPGSTFAVAVSLVPFFSPILMFARVAAGAAGVAEALASIVLMAGTLFACAWVAGRIYRVGILMQGKRPTLPEIVRWVREA